MKVEKGCICDYAHVCIDPMKLESIEYRIPKNECPIHKKEGLE